MKYVKRILLILALLGAVFYLLPAALLRAPFFQEAISKKVSSYLENRLHTAVEIRQIDLGMFNSLILRDVYMEDQSKDTLLYAKRISAGLDLMPLLKNQWHVNSVQLFAFQVNLTKKTDDSPLNIQYIIDAFSTKDSIKDNTIDLKISDIDLRSGTFSYRVKSEAKTEGRFNAKDLLFKDIAANIKIRNFAGDSLDMGIDRLETVEKSGLKIKQLNFDLLADKQKAKIEKITVKSAQSNILITNILADYSRQKDDKPDWKNTYVQMKIENSQIFPQEMSIFLPALENFDDNISIEGEFSGSLNNLNVENLYFRFFNEGMLRANAHFNDLLNPSELSMNCMIDESYFTMEGVERLINNFSKEPVSLPENLLNLGKLDFQGSLRGKPRDLTAWGILNSSVGRLKANITMGKAVTNFISGKISSDGLNLEKLMNSRDFGDFVFNITLDAAENEDKKFAGNLDANIEKAVYKGYTYNNVTFKGDFSESSFNGLFQMNSPEGKINGNGDFAFNGKNSEFRFNAAVEGLMLDKLNLAKNLENSLLSFNVSADFSGDNPDNFIGSALINGLNFRAKNGNLKLDSISIAADSLATGKEIYIVSDIINGSITGNYTFSSIAGNLKNTLARYLPSVEKTETVEKIVKRGKSAKYKKSEQEKPLAGDDFVFDFKIEDTSGLAAVFGLPFAICEQSRISGNYSSSGGNLVLKAEIPQMKAGGSNLQDVALNLNADGQQAGLQIDGTVLQKNDNLLKINLKSDAADDVLKTKIRWNRDGAAYKGEISLATRFSDAGDNSLRAENEVDRSEMVFNDSIWKLNPTKIIIDRTKIKIEHLQAAHNKQFVKIDGAVSQDPNERMLVELNEVDLKYIFNSLNIKALDFGGIATGYVHVRDVYKTRELSTKLDVKNFSFNSAVFGNLNLTGTWDDQNQGVLMDGIVIKNDSSRVLVNGIIYPVKEELSIDFDARNADARFLRKYLDQVAKNLSGELSGHLRLFGNLNDPTVEGDVFARNCRFGVEFLNTYYSFTDSIKCYPDEIIAKNIRIYDEKGNSGLANGSVRHTRFSDFHFQAAVNFDNLLVFNATRNLNPLFYGTAYGSGTVKLSGTETDVNIDVSMRNTERTNMTLNFMEEADIEDFDFIQFVQPKNAKPAVAKKTAKTVPKAQPSGTDVNLNLSVNINQEAAIEIIMDPATGDKISGNGQGNMQIQYGTKIPLKVMGNYRIESGKYNFSFQQAIFRNFDISEGSTLVFRGDPFTAELNVQAGYRVLANIGDLDQRLLEQSARTNVQVNCILKLTGPLNQPAIGFGLDLPGASTELNQQVRSYIRTEDMMNRQILYLMLFSRFYTQPEYASTTESQSDISMLTSSLSAQVLNLLGSNITDKLQVGTKFHHSYEGAQTTTEAELLLSSQLLNNRLIFNGNFGYVDNPMINGNNQSSLPLVGDFDIEYKLTKNGDIRLKGFNHYNYRYFSESPQMTQGLGILFRKDFNNFYEMFGFKKPDSLKVKAKNDTIR
ncbi:MAG: translocation/assembly module TamB domain-containing protein [Dysgonamonadaceae bacterium]|jgi:hypothetical protein|nr:translocation/assembly module TamB domain-containing protein [Dysgonamonadaceae bacterium]